MEEQMADGKQKQKNRERKLIDAMINTTQSTRAQLIVARSLAMT